MQKDTDWLMGERLVGTSLCSKIFSVAPFHVCSSNNVCLLAYVYCYRYNESQRRHGALAKPEGRDSLVQSDTSSKDKTAGSASEKTRRSGEEQILRAKKEHQAEKVS